MNKYDLILESLINKVNNNEIDLDIALKVEESAFSKYIDNKDKQAKEIKNSNLPKKEKKKLIKKINDDVYDKTGYNYSKSSLHLKSNPEKIKDDKKLINDFHNPEKLPIKPLIKHKINGYDEKGAVTAAKKQFKIKTKGKSGSHYKDSNTFPN